MTDRKLSELTSAGSLIDLDTGDLLYTVVDDTGVPRRVHRGRMREVVAQDATLNFYVNGTTGSDTNDGRSTTTAFRTIQRGLDAMSFVDTVEANCVLNIASGTYTEDLGFRWRVTDWAQFPGFGNVVGDTGTPSNVTIVGEHYVEGPEVWYLEGMKFQADTGAEWIFNSEGARVFFGHGIEFGAATNTFAHIWARNRSFFYFVYPYTISGGAGTHWRCESGSFIRAREFAITLTGTPAFSNAFLWCKLGTCQVDGLTWTGSATGKRFRIEQGGNIELASGDGLDYFPGNTPGTRQPGSCYGRLGYNLLAEGTQDTGRNLEFDMTEWTQFRTIVFSLTSIYPGAGGSALWLRTGDSGAASIGTGVADYDWGAYNIRISDTGGMIADDDAVALVPVAGFISSSMGSSTRIELTNWNTGEEPYFSWRSFARQNSTHGNKLEVQYGGGRRNQSKAIDYVRFTDSGLNAGWTAQYSVWGED